jgi:hypothetical protein
MLLGQSDALASVQGQVLNAVTGEPVPGAAVFLKIELGGGLLRTGSPATNPAFEAKTETDQQGHFALWALEPGTYMIGAQRQGFTGVLANEFGILIGGVRLALGEGQRVTGYALRLVPTSAISGKVTDSSGVPVGGATVSALCWIYSGKARFLTSFRSAQTDGVGEYRIANLNPGSYLVAAQPSEGPALPSNAPLGEPQTVTVPAFYASATDPDAGTAVSAKAGAEARGTDIRLATAKGVSVSGRIAGSAAQFEPISLSIATPSFAPGPHALPETVAPDGSFTIRGVPAGAYYLEAWGKGAAPDNAYVALARQFVEIGDTNLDGITVQLAPPANVQGTVKVEPAGTCDTSVVSVRVTESDGVFYGGAAHQQIATTDRDLKFTLHNVAPTTYFVEAVSRSGCYIKSIRHGGREAKGVEVSLAGDGPLEITLAPSTPLARVRAVDSQGNPLRQARVVAVPKDGGPPVMKGTGFDGRAGFGLRPGAYSVFAFEETSPDMQSPAYLKGFEGRAKSVTLEEGENAEIEVTVIPASETMDPALSSLPSAPPRAKGSASGLVLNAITGAPVADATVSLNLTTAGAPWPATAQTDDRGRFSLRGVEPGYYIPQAVREGFLPAVSYVPLGKRILIGDGQDLEDVVLKLTPQPRSTAR